MQNYSADNHQQQLFSFLQRNQQNLIKPIRALSEQERKTKIKAVILSQQSEKDLQQASQYLQKGGLVSFPTETVYGLGANALNKEALLKIYATKKRPLTDPIIVHVLEASDALKYVSISEGENQLFQLLAAQFWPGPLTMILKADLNILPSCVTAETGYVGIRCPSHHYFRKLLQKSQLPIGAPSANLFSHVSPTQALHVFNDFYSDQVLIVDGDRCQFGIESTVVKIVDNEILVFREGSLSVDRIQSFLSQKLEKQKVPKVRILKKTADQKENTEAPGQLLKHYSPNIPCFFVESLEQIEKINHQSLKKIGVISFSSQKYRSLESSVGSYMEVGKNLHQQNEQADYDEKYCSKEEIVKMRQIYYLLRLLENFDLEKIVICWSGPKAGTIWDKVFRSTENKRLTPDN